MENAEHFRYSADPSELSEQRRDSRESAQAVQPNEVTKVITPFVDELERAWRGSHRAGLQHWTDQLKATANQLHERELSSAAAKLSFALRTDDDEHVHMLVGQLRCCFDNLFGQTTECEADTYVATDGYQENTTANGSLTAEECINAH